MQVLEVAVIHVKPGKINDFESSVRKASRIISNAKGYVSHELQKCVEQDNQYILLVKWESIKHNLIGFRTSPEYEEWKSLLQPYFDTEPDVGHYININLKS
ncbi:antibiotic biosynthesis monooxygenase [Paenibacillus yonginensis]|uniref:Antibiotic biosynthesis monooxygenase n=2 Tax=Paenibacillus yonginensis TaxID=1462996 RepID=A0A1B1N6R9_9BACL|nr:antibiotic biosynthesis monooxygenase [Paenibacillus yonginensis]